MPFPSFTTGAVAPVDGKEARDRKKQHRHSSRQPSIRKRPILLNVRSSDYFIFSTAAIGLFSSVSLSFLKHNHADHLHTTIIDVCALHPFSIIALYHQPDKSWR